MSSHQHPSLTPLTVTNDSDDGSSPTPSAPPQQFNMKQRETRAQLRTPLKNILPSAEALVSRYKTEVIALECRVMELQRIDKIRSRTLARLTKGQPLQPPPPLTRILSILDKFPGGNAEVLPDLVAYQEDQSSYVGISPMVFANEDDRAALVQRVGRALRYTDGYFNTTWEVTLLRLSKQLLTEPQYRDQMETLWLDWPLLYVKRRMSWRAPLEIQEEASKCANNSIFSNIEARNYWLATAERREELKSAFIPVIKGLSRPDLVCDAQVGRVFKAMMGLISGQPDDGGDKSITEFLMNECDFLTHAVSRVAFTYYEAMSSRNVPTRRKLLRARALHGSYESTSRFVVLDLGLRVIYAFAYCATDAVIGKLTENSGKNPLEEATLYLPHDLVLLDIGVGDQFALFLAGVLTTETYDEEDSEELDKIILRVCTTLMFVEKSVDLVRWLTKQGAVKGVVELLTRQMMRCHASSTGSSQLVDMVLPVLVSLKTLAMTHRSALHVMQELLCSPMSFLPPHSDNPKLSAEENARLKEQRHFQGYAVAGTPFWYLVKLMTTFEDHVKRTAEELCWTLCNEDADTVVFRCGFGNAAHLLAVQGGMLGQIMAQQEAQQAERMKAMRGGG